MIERASGSQSAGRGTARGRHLLILTIVIMLVTNGLMYAVADADRYWTALFLGFIGGPLVNGLLFALGTTAILLGTRGRHACRRTPLVLWLLAAALVSAGLLAAGVGAMDISGC
jgi:hypothetical protein